MDQDSKPKTEAINALSVLTELKLDYVYSRLLINPRLVIKADYKDSTRYGLTKCIVDYVNLNGGIAVAVNSTSRYRLTQGWTDRKTRLKLGDVIALFQGNSFHIEVKRKENFDKVNRAAIRIEVEKSGASYYNAQTFESFYEWFHSVALKQG